MLFRGPESRVLPEKPAAAAGSQDAGDAELLDAVAARVVRMRMSVPAVFFLESAKPFSFVAGQALVFFEPFVRAFLTVPRYERFIALMEDRENVETLIQRIEDLDLKWERAEKQRKREERVRRRAERGPGWRRRLARWWPVRKPKQRRGGSDGR